ncbi:DEAD/DEAH box helicase family protein [Iamia majanohamensis]|uniref:DEAD/DEAH box helicase family protein n=1 Tax=Iamia majanohamensis TaxID=467976 RepID=A0AAF0BSA1_9ACTN|nr:DEAD/DEAH box helicase family protein [Iamia majanohamensis]WCO67971.1 DEAD/DEAH box helicase family protein [Iamia majanohamensis]
MVLNHCRDEGGRWATADEQAVLARWSGWGAIPQVFDPDDDRHAAERCELRRLLRTEDGWAQARRTTLNAHYTSAPVVHAMWHAAHQLGVDRGVRVLEPGCGSGNFVGFAPEGARLTGIELDRTTAEIAEHLYGARATIYATAFEELRVEEGAFDVVIGNVPFAKVTPHDPRHNRGRHALHNYFLIKSLHLTRPGGLVVALTSRYTLDARNPAARREMASMADLVGAVRLPERAFARSSGTDVVVDMVILRRRLPGAQPTGPAWESVGTAPIEVDEGVAPLEVNEYYLTRPERVLGDLAAARGMYRDHELTVVANGHLDEQLPSALAVLVAEARDRGLSFVSTTRADEVHPERHGACGHFDLIHAQDGSFVVNERGEVAQLHGGTPVAYQPRVAQDRSELARLVGIRDAARAVLAVQVDGGTDEQLSSAQTTLTERYRSYVRINGPINRSSQARTGRRDAETGEEVMRRVRPRMGGFREDPDWPLVAALEVFDDETQQARPAAIFHERVVDPPHERHGVDSPDEAVAVCLDETGTITVDRVAELLGTDPATAREHLGELVYDEPGTGRLVAASEYLAGNVRDKLDACRRADDPEGRYRRNVAALERVLPRQLEPAEITARLGAPWVPSRCVEQFCREVLDASVDVEHLPQLGHWSARLRDGSRRSVALSSEWGTSRADAVTLLDAALNQRLHAVTDATEDGRRVRNDAETLAARDKQEALTTRFSTWVWEEPERASLLAGRYNELFSSTVLPVHDGSHLTLPGLAGTFTPRPHQRAAVARILTDGRSLLAHAVGAGKTATMVMAAMELRRLGSASKPAVVVPNHMLDQFTREWLQLYPTARILVADRERLSKARRKEFVARAATGDWDGIVFTQSGFARLPLGRELMTDYLGEEIATARTALAGSKDGKGLSVKKLERRISQLEETYKRLLAAHTKDDGVRFEETAIDYLFVDEAHAYKNRRVDSSIDGVATTGSQRAQDLDSKLWALRRMHGPRVVTFATATPVANSMAELWVMQSYLHPDLLASVDMRAFDSWAANFGRTHTALELAPDGASYRMQTRFARFQNVPELLTLYRQVADVRTNHDLDLPVPALAGGQAETVVVEPSDALIDYVADLASRAAAIRNRAVDPSEDNMLKVTGDGRRAALDLRLVGEHPPSERGKLAVAAQRIAAIHHATRDLRYTDDHGQLTLRPGALQLVFCDVSTPAAEGWNAYDELRALVVRRGVDHQAIGYMQGAKTDVAKAKLFTACRDGSVSVLIGSTETMGVGTNVQSRAIAMHHLDAPWRPADIEQRDGRILRQGNQNPEVRVLRYVTEGSFDTYMWQTLERKAAFIAQVTRGDLPDRDVEDIGDQALSFAEVKALATGDPLVLEKAAVDADVARLARLERAHLDDQHRLRRTLESATRRADVAGHRSADLQTVLGRVTDTRGERFAMTVDGQTHAKRVDAGEHLQRLLRRRLDQTAPETSGPVGKIGSLGGLTVTAQAVTTIEDEIRIAIPDARIEVGYLASDLTRSDPTNLITRLERHLHRLPDTIAELSQEAATARGEADRAAARVGVPWDRAEEFASLRRRQKEIDEQLAPTTESPENEQGAAPAAAPTTDAPRSATPLAPARPGGEPADHTTAERMSARLDAIQARSRVDEPTVGL